MQQVLPINMMSFADVLGLEPKEEDVLEPYRDEEKKIPGDVDFEPDAATVMHQLMVAYLRNTFYYALIDSAAAEQGARRTAMKSATDNATEMAETLTRLLQPRPSGRHYDRDFRNRRWRSGFGGLNMSEHLLTREELEASKGATGRIVRIVGPVVERGIPRGIHAGNLQRSYG